MMTIQEALHPLRLTRCYKGFRQTEFAIALVISEEDRLEAVTKEVYAETAAFFGCKWTAVEHNIRTAVKRAWRVNPSLLSQMAGYPLDGQPTASQFIEIISNYIIRSSQPQESVQSFASL